MSKYVKNLMAQELSQRLAGVQDALLVNVIGLDANQTCQLRKRLREQDIQLMVVKNSLARRAAAGTPLEPAFRSLDGPLAIVWGGEDFVSLVKEIRQLHEGDQFEAFQARGGVMEGEQLTPERILEISTWPSRQEQLSLLLGQILSPGGRLSAQLLGPGGAVASQIEQKAEDGAG